MSQTLRAGGGEVVETYFVSPPGSRRFRIQLRAHAAYRHQRSVVITYKYCTLVRLPRHFHSNAFSSSSSVSRHFWYVIFFIFCRFCRTKQTTGPSVYTRSSIGANGYTQLKSKNHQKHKMSYPGYPPNLVSTFFLI